MDTLLVRLLPSVLDAQVNGFATGLAMRQIRSPRFLDTLVRATFGHAAHVSLATGTNAKGILGLLLVIGRYMGEAELLVVAMSIAHFRYGPAVARALLASSSNSGIEFPCLAIGCVSNLHLLPIAQALSHMQSTRHLQFFFVGHMTKRK